MVNVYCDISIACSFDLLDICINGPKEKLDSTVISQVLYLTTFTGFLSSSIISAMGCTIAMY